MIRIRSPEIFLGTSGRSWEHPGDPGNIWKILGTSGGSWEHLGSSWELPGNIRGILGTSGNIWEYLGTSGNIRELKYTLTQIHTLQFI
jgi:hypothetical protein